VFNLKWGGAAGIFAFVLSLVIGLFSGTGLFALIRALIFGTLFFLLGCGAYWLVSRFLSDLIEGDGEEVPENALGSAVDISLEDEALPLAAGERALRENTLDQNGEDGYTEKGIVENEPALPENGGGAALPAGGTVAVPGAASGGEVDELPDMDAMVAAFIAPGDGEAPATEDQGPAESLFISPSGASRGNPKARDLVEGFKTNDMASAIQTILKREKG
jgi:hypothetical protein